MKWSIIRLGAGLLGGSVTWWVRGLAYYIMTQYFRGRQEYIVVALVGLGKDREGVAFIGGIGLWTSGGEPVEELLLVTSL